MKTMSKSRDFGSSVYDRWIHYSGHDQSPTDADLAELAEEDVWSIFGPDSGSQFDGSSARRWLPRHVGGLSLAFDATCDESPRIVRKIKTPERKLSRETSRSRSGAAASSAPVSVPNWGRMAGVGWDDSVDGGDALEGADEGEWVPPHEYVARSGKAATTATSVFEGVGRTLKGRDMRRVRDAVWSRTGFFG